MWQPWTGPQTQQLSLFKQLDIHYSYSEHHIIWIWFTCYFYFKKFLEDPQILCFGVCEPHQFYQTLSFDAVSDSRKFETSKRRELICKICQNNLNLDLNTIFNLNYVIC